MLVKSSRVFLCWFLSWFKNRRWDTGLPRARRLQRPGRPELMWWTEKDRTAFWGCQRIQKKGGVFFWGFFSRFFCFFFSPFSGGRKVRGRKEGRKEGKGREGKERKGKERREEGRKEGWYACFAAMLWQNHKGGWYGPPWCGRGGGAGGKGEVFRFVAGFCSFGAIAASRAILVVLFNIKPVAGWLCGCKLSYHGEIGWMVWPTNCYVEYYGMTATAVCNDNATKVDDKAHLYCEWMYHDHVTLCKGEAPRPVFFFTWILRGYCMSIEHIYIRCQGSREV